MTAGYNPAEVPSKLCLMCKQPIGHLEWREVKTLARFGQMLFEHVTCPEPKKLILDASCGGRMFWFNKHHPAAIYMDNRTLEPTKLSNRATLEVKPDIVGDFRDMPFEDNSFALVVFDPPHLFRIGATGYVGKKYGGLDKNTWRRDIQAGFMECFRVLRPQGVLVFKWNDSHVPLKDVLELAPIEPLFGNRATGKNLKTHWLVFMKGDK